MESHLKAMKEVFKYLARTKDYIIRYLRGGALEFIEYSNIDHACYKLKRKSAFDF